MARPDINDTLIQDFLQSSEDRLDAVESLMSKALEDKKRNSEHLFGIRRQIHSIKGMASSLGFPVCATIAHRMEDFIEDDKVLTKEVASELSKFFDLIREIIDSGNESRFTDVPATLRSLPVRRIQGDFSIDVLDVEVLMVTPSAVNAKIVRRELANCGFRVVRATTSMEAFQLVIRAQPDIAIFQMELDELPASELCRAFRAITRTAGMPIAILTSRSLDHPSLQGLPDDIFIVRMSRQEFEEDMGDFLAHIQMEFI